jgi:hypothetical protein
LERTRIEPVVKHGRIRRRCGLTVNPPGFPLPQKRKLREPCPCGHGFQCSPPPFASTPTGREIRSPERVIRSIA